MDNKVNFLRGTSAEYEATTKDNDTFYYTTDDEKLYLGESKVTGIRIDDTSTTATDKTWSAKKINDSIPTELPANGGNADTVNTIAGDMGDNTGNVYPVFVDSNNSTSTAETLKTSELLQFWGSKGGVSLLTIGGQKSSSGLLKLYDGTGDYFSALRAANNPSSNVNCYLPDESGTLALKEDIPAKLPADGGNADTVGNKGISQILAVKGWFDGDMNNLKEQGSYIANGATNMPIPGGWGTVLVYAGGTGSVVQIFTAYVTSTSDLCKTYIRHFTGDLWSTWVNIADSGNADTLDGKHASDFSQIISFRDTPTDTKTAIGIQGKTTTYWCSAWTDYPATLQDGQGMIIAVNYKSYGTSVGVDNIWCRQVFITPHNSKIYQRLINATTVGEWVSIIDSSTVASSTSSGIVSTGEQHFGGRKFFDDSIFIPNPDFLVGSTLPSADTTRLLIFASSDNSTGNASAWVQNVARAAGNNELYLSLRSLTSKKTFTALCAKINADGSNYYAYVTNPTQSTQVALRNISSGTATATTTNCPSGSWYGKHS